MFVLGLVAQLIALTSVASATMPCTGDCSGDGAVSIDEVLLMVNIALEQQPASRCAAGDTDGNGSITVNEILEAVGHALNGCVDPTPTPRPLGGIGSTCITDPQCASGFCTDGRCCNVDSCPDGQRCSLSVSYGSCARIRGDGESCLTASECLPGYICGVFSSGTRTCRWATPTPANTDTPGPPSPTFTPIPIPKVVIGDIQVAPGATTTLNVSLLGDGLPVVALSHEFHFNIENFEVNPLLCAPNQSLRGSFSANRSDGDYGVSAIEIGIGASPSRSTIPDGPVYSCMLLVDQGIRPGCYWIDGAVLHSFGPDGRELNSTGWYAEGSGWAWVSVSSDGSDACYMYRGEGGTN